MYEFNLLDVGFNFSEMDKRLKKMTVEMWCGCVALICDSWSAAESHPVVDDGQVRHIMECVGCGATWDRWESDMAMYYAVFDSPSYESATP